MKREGRQHGVVRSYAIVPTPLSSDHRRYVKTVDSASVSGVFAKVSRKPTNQSKFTGKCSGKTRCLGCHLHPACKSKDKAKGTMKFRSVGSDSALIASGTSASGVLAYLASEGSYDHDYDDDCDGYENAIDDNHEYSYQYHDNDNDKVEFAIGLASIVTEESIGVEDDDDDDDDDVMSYCDVGLSLGDMDMDHGDEHEDDGWYMVGYIQE